MDALPLHRTNVILILAESYLPARKSLEVLFWFKIHGEPTEADSMTAGTIDLHADAYEGLDKRFRHLSGVIYEGGFTGINSVTRIMDWLVAVIPYDVWGGVF